MKGWHQSWAIQYHSACERNWVQFPTLNSKDSSLASCIQLLYGTKRTTACKARKHITWEIYHQLNNVLSNTLFLFKGAKTHSSCQFLVHSNQRLQTTSADLCHWARVEITEKGDNTVTGDARLCCAVGNMDAKTLALFLTTHLLSVCLVPQTPSFLHTPVRLGQQSLGAFSST